MKETLKVFTLLLLCHFSMEGFSQDSIEVKTKQDNYKVLKSGNDWTIDGAKVRTEFLKPLTDLVDQQFSAPCADNKARFGITIKINRPDQSEELRGLDIDKGLLKGPKGCLLVSGPGLSEFPLHRNWLIGPFEDSVAIKDSFKVGMKSGEIVSLKETKGEWSSSDPSYEFNWEFFEQFKQALTNYPIEKRYSLTVAKGKPVVTVLTGGKRHRFVQLAPTVWAKVHSTHPWLETSSYWSNWGDLTQSQWVDKNSDVIRYFKNTTHSAAERRKKIDALGGIWNPNLRDAFQNCLLDESDDKGLRLYCADRLRMKPTNASLHAFIRLINSSEDGDLLKKAESALRIKNPKGAKYNGPKTESKFKSYWNSWWASENSN